MSDIIKASWDDRPVSILASLRALEEKVAERASQNVLLILSPLRELLIIQAPESTQEVEPAVPEIGRP